ncbi:MAG: phosphotransferase [Muribaculaceae bacterium]|nr:phosphotransferase [Muribaculaceae bacterium]
MKEIEKLSEQWCGRRPAAVSRLAGAGSSRRYYRLIYSGHEADGHVASAVATAGDDVRENDVFCALARVFGKRAEQTGLFRVPEIYARSADGRLYLQEDFGDLSLLDLIRGEDDETVVCARLRSVLDALLSLQTTPVQEWSGAIGCRPFGERRVRWDLNYFKYAFIKPCGIVCDEERLEDEFEALAHRLCGYPAEVEGFMYRDFQSRNIMYREGDDTPCLIDFQGGMRGPALYDAVSLLWQAKAGLSAAVREKMMRYYIGGLAAVSGVEESCLTDLTDGFVLLRTLQVLGAYGFRGLIERKAHFIESIPPALANLASLISKGVLAPYPELERCCRALTALDRFAQTESDRLTVEVWSFSYKKGYPENLTGNGGGFVFDCRGLHNPGRYEEYKSLTGLDRPVIDFLERYAEVAEYLGHASGMVMPTVETYRRRGFNHLQVAFGCTGGRHRSVYCAQNMARRIKDAYPDVEVRIVHREQGIDRLLKTEER